MPEEQNDTPQGQSEDVQAPQEDPVVEQPQVSQAPEKPEDAQKPTSDIDRPKAPPVADKPQPPKPLEDDNDPRKPTPSGSSIPQSDARQDIEKRSYSSLNAKVETYKRMRVESNKNLEHWMKVFGATDRVFQTEYYKQCKLKIDSYLEELSELDKEIGRLEEDAEAKTRNADRSDNTVNISNRMRGAFDRDKIFAIFVVMFPQMEWLKLEEIFNEVVERIGNVPTVAQQRLAIEKAKVRKDDPDFEVLPQQSIFDEGLNSIVERLEADFVSSDVGGDTVNVIGFNNMPEMENFIRRQYSAIIVLTVIKALFELVTNKPNLRWYERQQIAYAIGSFTQLGQSKIYDYIKQYWANSESPQVRATTGYLLSRALETGIPIESVFDFLKELIDTTNSNFQWTAASACKEIGNVKIGLALDIIKYIFKRKMSGREQYYDVEFVFVVIYSCVVLGLNGFYREVLKTLSKWIKEETDVELRKVQITFFMKTLSELISRVRSELSVYGKFEIGKQKNIESKCLEALWMNFTQDLDEDVKRAIIDVLVTIIRSPADIIDVLISQANVDLLGTWLDAFSDEGNKKTYEPKVRDIVEDLLVSVYGELSSSAGVEIKEDKQSSEEIKTRRRRISTIQTNQTQNSYEFTGFFWLLIEQWKQASPGEIKNEVFNAVEKSIKTEGSLAKGGSGLSRRRRL
ncbi:hypothetical protein MBAV_003188 [Candidatus Magnetobacterium bavaricum]|uniref:Uncharacterized protein n=1 Tax=Candidatus Magnetobacterium bavaricum TaxID=29290 RepID=A0A0F3GS34_9BACT|nr:hypothetical protein MBAV_003188 [Candidatus Magnetobacterium bavaricum]